MLSKLIRITGIVLVVLAGVAYAAFRVLQRDLCRNTVIARYPSPNRANDAVIFLRDCGATTSASTQVTLLRSGEAPPNAGGNVLVVDVSDSIPPTSFQAPLVGARWIGSDTLELRYDPRLQVFKQVERLGGVTIRHDTANIRPRGA